MTTFFDLHPELRQISDSFHLIETELTEIKKRNIDYPDDFAERYFAERYTELERVINDTELSDIAKCQTLRAKGLEKLSYAILIVYAPKLKNLFLLEPVNSHNTSALTNGLAYITDMASQDLSLAFFALKDAEFREALLTHEHGGSYMTILAAPHKTIALFIIQEDTELLNKILSSTSNFSNIIEIVSQHEEAFIAFFQDQKLQADFLKMLGKSLLNAEIWTVGYKFQIFDNDKDMQTWLDQGSPKELINHIMQVLRERRQSATETQTNEADISMPRP